MFLSSGFIVFGLIIALIYWQKYYENNSHLVIIIITLLETTHI